MDFNIPFAFEAAALLAAGVRLMVCLRSSDLLPNSKISVLVLVIN
ncbi:hypothetical protein RINTU1_00450 [Candidatus Regiella insecticola]|uniref:Uncharacterized protein n=1 Tax=Candidatus Regiella insecticola TaxID=138073 RepID=A0A6L2ZKU4_9ENTR|nr:hypothetical protein RINTU1_00450 [Candidatus Regiella insecticola]